MKKNNKTKDNMERGGGAANVTDFATEVLTQGAFRPDQVDEQRVRFGAPETKVANGVAYQSVPIYMDLGGGITTPLKVKTQQVRLPTSFSQMDKGAFVVDVQAAFHARDVSEFMDLVFPPSWGGIKARIIETGVAFEEGDATEEKFALGWSFIRPTIRRSKRGNERETWFKSMLFRVHDVLHQLFSLFVPDNWEDEDELRHLKRMWMCAEVAVLTLTEFVYCQWLYDTQPHLREFLEHRNTLLFKNTTQLADKSPKDIASVLDQLLHLKARPKWVTNNPHGAEFLRDFVPMLQVDRVNIDYNFELLRAQQDKEYLKFMPKPCYGKQLDGRELTVWMIKYFELMKNTGDAVDEGLAEFNRQRRSKLNLPDGWNDPTPQIIDQMWAELESRTPQGFYKRN